MSFSTSILPPVAVTTTSQEVQLQTFRQDLPRKRDLSMVSGLLSRENQIETVLAWGCYTASHGEGTVMNCGLARE